MRIGLLLAPVLALLHTPPAQAQQTRYSLAGGCYAVDVIDGAQQVRMRATTLGRYLLYLPDGRYLTAAGPAEKPGPEADWGVEEDGAGGFTMATLAEPERKVPVRFTEATGCAEIPEAQLNATGTPARRLPFARTTGT